MNFFDFLVRRSEKDDFTGRFAKQALADINFPATAKLRREFLQYLENSGRYSPAAINWFKEAWFGFQDEKKSRKLY